MVSEKLQKRMEKLQAEDKEEIRITKRYIDAEDTIFDVASYVYNNIESSFFVIECELKYTSNQTSKVYSYSFEVQTVNKDRLTDFNMKKELKQRIDNIMTDIGYTNNIQLENRIITITINR